MWFILVTEIGSTCKIILKVNFRKSPHLAFLPTAYKLGGHFSSPRKPSSWEKKH